MRKVFDAAVIGGGHAGIEAGVALAKKGHNTLVLTICLDAVGFMACNPNIGGTAKGHLVKEIDALGGVMGKVADRATIQTRMLNLGNGPAVHSLRNQVDKQKYHALTKQLLERQENLWLAEGEAVELRQENGGWLIKTEPGGEVFCKAVVLATGVYLNSRIIIGEYLKDCGPAGFMRAEKLTQSLINLGLPVRRFKTGTPPRILKNSVDFDKMERQDGDRETYPFSEDTDFEIKNDMPCYLTYTNEKTHKLILENLDRSPMYNGAITGQGPRYCPAVETKVVRFADKERHQIFIEPEGENTDEMYVQGLSTSMPCDIQEKMLNSIKGLENAKITRYGYAIEYDCLDPQSVLPTMQVKGFAGLYAAGQINGSSGYEEAAAQGLVAGVNAAMYLENAGEWVLSRQDAYIGVLIDDLVTKGTEEPYRMMTSRAEHRLHLRQDNADIRLTEIGREIGLIDEERYRRFAKKLKDKETLFDGLKKHYKPSEVESVFAAKGQNVPANGISGYEILKRNGLSYTDLIAIDGGFCENYALLQQLETEIKYQGYLQKEERAIKEMRKMEAKKLPELDYNEVNTLRTEARHKLNAVKPLTVAQAARIPGVNPADIAALIIYLQKRKEK